MDRTKWPLWLVIANKEMENHVQEIAGDADNPRIVEYHSTTTLCATDDETPWCSAFVNWCMKQAEEARTKLANARSWLTWGSELKEPQVGCVVVLKRGSSPTSGHVGFYIETIGDHITVLGGNQGDRVKLSLFPKSQVLGYRWPKEKKG